MAEKTGTGGDRADLFDEPLIGRLAGGPRRYGRGWLTGRIKAHLEDPDCRIVVLTGAPGAGKSAVMAHLAQERPDWPRYFIRRIGEPDSDAYRHEGGLASFLTLIGFQLLALHPQAFPGEDTQLDAELVTAAVGSDADVSVVRVAEWFAHPFRHGALRARMIAALVQGRATAVEIGKMVVDVASLEPAALEAPALLDPLGQLAASHPKERVVALLDGLDELRFRDAAADVGRWLTRHPQFPSNLRIVVASRPDSPLLRELKYGHKQAVREVAIDLGSHEVRQDVDGYLRNLAGESGISAVLTSHGVSGERFVRQVSPKVGGNFLYATMITRLLDADAAHLEPGPGSRPPVPDLDWLDRIETLPGELPGFYALLLWSVHNRIGGAAATRQQWDDLYHPLLGLLAVTTLPLTGRQFREFGEIEMDQATVDGALDRLQFFLDGDRAKGFRLHHTSMAEFLTGKATAQSDPPLYCDRVTWHGRITEHAIRRHQPTGTWRDADPYLRARLPFHAAESGRLDGLVEDPEYLLAADPDALVPELGAVSRAEPVARVYQQVVPMVREQNPADAQAHLKLYAEQAGLVEFAAQIAMDRATSPWLLDFTHWQTVRLRQVLGRHDGETDAVAVARTANGDPLAVTGGVDGRIRIWDLSRGCEADGAPLPERPDGAGRLSRITALTASELDTGEAIAVSGGLDGAVRAWNLITREPVGGPLIGAENSGFAVAAAFAGGAPQAVCRVGDEFRAWNLHAQTPASPPFPGDNVLRDEAMAAGEWGSRMVFAAVVKSGGGARVQVRDTATGEACGPVIQAADDWITAIALAEIGGTLLAAIADGDHGIQVFTVATGRPFTRRTLDIGLPVVNALAIGTIGGHLVLAAGDDSGRILFREIPSLCRFGDPVQAHGRRVTAVAFGVGDDGGLLTSVGKDDAPSGMSLPVSARIWKPGKHGRKLHPVTPPIDLPDPARSVALGRVAGRLEAVTADGRRVVRWDVSAGTAAGTPLGGGNERVCAVGTATVAGRTLAVSATYGKATIRTWNIPKCTPARHPVTGQQLIRRDVETVRGLAVTRLGDRAVAVCAGWGDIHVWDAATGEPAGAGLINGPKNVMSLAVGELAGRPIAACACDQGVMAFDLETGDPLDPPYPGFGLRPDAVAIAEHRGRALVVSGGPSLALCTWDPASGRDPAMIHVAGETSVLAAAYIRDRPVAVCSGRKGEVRLVDLAPASPGSPPAADQTAAVNGLVIADAGGQRVVVCATDHGVQVLDLATGDNTAPQPRQPGRPKAIAVAAGTLHGRPVAVAGGYPNHAWYLDTGEPLSPQPTWPETAHCLAVANVAGRTVAVAGTWSSGVLVTDLETGELVGEPETGLPSGPIRSVGVVLVSGRPVLVTRTSMGIRARYLELPWLPLPDVEMAFAGFEAVEDTLPPPHLFPGRRLTRHPHDGGWCMALGMFEGHPIVASGHDHGQIDLFAVATGLPISSLAGGKSPIGALAYHYLGKRPVIAAGAIDGVVRLADLNDLSALTIITTLAPVRALALAEPDHCLIGTEKGLIAVRILFPSRPGQATGTQGCVHLPTDSRATRSCPQHGSHQHDAEQDGHTVPMLCLKGVQLTWGRRKPQSLSYPAGHCYVMPGRVTIVASGAEKERATPPLLIDLTHIYAEPVDDPEAYLKDGCHFGVAVHGDGNYRVLSCYRRSERDWLVKEINHQRLH